MNKDEYNTLQAASKCVYTFYSNIWSNKLVLCIPVHVWLGWGHSPM